MKNSNDETFNPTFRNTVLPAVSLRDYFASQAMLAVMQETQEMRIGSFWDWVKQLLVTYLHFTFLTVKYVKVENVYEEAAKRAYEYADALLSVRNGR
jgi:hypothetical protein